MFYLTLYSCALVNFICIMYSIFNKLLYVFFFIHFLTKTNNLIRGLQGKKSGIIIMCFVNELSPNSYGFFIDLWFATKIKVMKMNNRFQTSVLILGCKYLDKTIFANNSFMVPFAQLLNWFSGEWSAKSLSLKSYASL